MAGRGRAVIGSSSKNEPFAVLDALGGLATVALRGIALKDCAGAAISVPGGKVGEKGDCKLWFELILLVRGGGGGMLLLD